MKTEATEKANPSDLILFTKTIAYAFFRNSLIINKLSFEKRIVLLT